MQTYPNVILKPGKEQSLLRRHPWIFSGAIHKIDGTLNEGDIVTVVDNKGNFLATGYYQIGSIAVRTLTFKNEAINYVLIKERIARAFQLRKSLNLADNSNNNVYRLIHGEGDELPGLIIDFYNGTAVMQCHTVGAYLLKDMVVNALQEVMGNRLTSIFDKSEGTMPFKAKVKATNGYIWGNSSTDSVLEYGNQFKIDWVEGQKTGFFVDQRENRLLLQKYSANRDVLNMFCYTGGFSVYALRGNAQTVHSVDSSKKAIDLTNENVALNFPNSSNHEAFAVDAFEYLQNIDQKYDLIILDPPAFAKHNDALDNALQGYKKINQKALEQIRPGGILFTFSCSQVVTKENFRKSVFAAAANAKRSVSIIHQLTQPADHPVSIFHPEGEYLKGLVVYVD